MVRLTKWGKVLESYIIARKAEGKPLRDQVWKEMQPLRQALEAHREADNG